MPISQIGTASISGLGYGFKNRIINGAMMIDQRNAGAAKSVSTLTSTYVLDRWYWYITGAALNIQQVASGVTGISYVMQATGATSNTGSSFGTRIESKNIADLAGSTVTVSFQASSSVLTTMALNLYYANTSDNFSGETQIGSTVNFTINSTLTQYSTTFTLPANAANGVETYFSLGAMTSGTFKITNVQLEKGTVATSFDYRPYGTELALCQRYLQKWNANASYLANGLLGVSGTNTSSRFILPYVVTPRTYPTGIVSTTASNFQVVTCSGGIAVSALTFAIANDAGLVVQTTNTAGTLGQAVVLYGGASDYIYTTGCEL